jgi:hypothetical protein
VLVVVGRDDRLLALGQGADRFGEAVLGLARVERLLGIGGGGVGIVSSRLTWSPEESEIAQSSKP